MTIRILESLVFVGTLIAAVAVAAVCCLGLVVWVAGGRSNPRLK